MGGLFQEIKNTGVAGNSKLKSPRVRPIDLDARLSFPKVRQVALECRVVDGGLGGCVDELEERKVALIRDGEDFGGVSSQRLRFVSESPMWRRVRDICLLFVEDGAHGEAEEPRKCHQALVEAFHDADEVICGQGP